MSKPGIGVRVRRNESIEAAMKRFRKKCEKEGLFNEIKKRSFYKKPSTIRREKQMAAERKAMLKKKKRNKKRRRR